MLSATDITALLLTLKLAALTAGLLLLVCTPLAWWLANSGSRLRPAVEALVTLPLVLPPTVLGFYLLLLLGSQGPFAALGGEVLAFSFSGLVLGSLIYSLPFVVQPLANAFRAIDPEYLETAATLGASPLRRFLSIALPLAKPGYITAAVFGFAHTLGEFGVVLMIGGNIPGETRVVSISIYEHVDSLAFAEAHRLALVLLAISFGLLLALFTLGKQRSRWLP